MITRNQLIKWVTLITILVEVLREALSRLPA